MKKLLMILPLVCLVCFIFRCQKAEDVAEEGLAQEEVQAFINRVVTMWNEHNI